MNNYDDVITNYQKWYLDLKNEETYEKRRKEFLEYHQNSGITRVQIEPTQRCNYSCEMCPIDELDTNISKKDLTLEQFKLIISDLPKSVNTICMSGLGEPFLNKDYIEMVKYAKNRGYILEVYNNGSMFKSEILEFVDYIYFSVDAVNEELIKQLRKGVKYDKLFDSINDSINYRDVVNSNLKVMINFTISNKNYEEIPLLFQLCDTLKINLLQIQAMANNYSNDSQKYDSFSHFIEKNSFTDWKYIVDSYSKDFNFSLTIWYPRELKGFCNWTFSSLYITKDMYIISCCHKVTKPLIFGNLKINNFDEILSSKKIIDFKKSQLEKSYISLCEKCPY